MTAAASVSWRGVDKAASSRHQSVASLAPSH
jgi:hypothetical protein